MKVCGSWASVLQSSRLPDGNVTGEQACFELVDCRHVGQAGRVTRLVLAVDGVVEASDQEGRVGHHREVVPARGDEPVPGVVGVEVRVDEVEDELAAADATVALMYFTAAVAPSTPPWKRPGANALSTSATMAMWISLAVTPISESVGSRRRPRDGRQHATTMAIGVERDDRAQREPGVRRQRVPPSVSPGRPARPDRWA